MMGSIEIDERPTKKRRFFIEEPPIPESTLDRGGSPPTEIEPPPKVSPQPEEAPSIQTEDSEEGTGFDGEFFKTIVGEDVSPSTLKELQKICGNDIQHAINMYLDGSWSINSVTIQPVKPDNGVNSNHSSAIEAARPVTVPRRPAPIKSPTPSKRYIGAFGVVGWATRSGLGLLKHDEKVGIERTKSQPNATPGKGAKSRFGANKRQDTVVRFTNAKGEEVGRLENESAAWISSLLDQNICEFEGSCVFAPDRLRTNDTIYLQLRCFLRKRAFEASAFVKPLDNNRATGLFDAKESQEERMLRLRQVALVRLFDEIKLHPSRVNEDNEKQKRQGLLKAAETAETAEQNEQKGGSKAEGGDSGSHSPSSDGEEGEELEQDQLDALYKKAQSFDFNTPEAEPADTFAMNLRKYQKQALFWMIGKEKDQKSEHKESSMHPLWEEYTWPTRDVDDKELLEVSDQPKFYVNPYSGELSLEFPVQEQNCLGGILADEMGLGKTIEMFSLIHTHRIEPASISNRNGPSVNDLPRLSKQSSIIEKAPCTTLVVAPMSLLAQWQSEAEKSSKPGSLKVIVYYGNEKSANLQRLCCESNAVNAPNVVITSYGVVLSEFNQVAASGGNRGSHGGLFSLEYFRIILDEAHYIKNRQSKTAKACYELGAVHRWVLTGTPIVNRLEDLFSLVRFLRVEPWSNFSYWKTFITVPFESKDFIRALDVVQTVLEPLVLRRTKDMKTPEGEALVPLPPKTIIIDQVELSRAEREVYDYIYTRAKRTFNANVDAGTLLKSYTTIFAQILRLRQSCCHPVLTRNKNIVSDEEDAADAADLASGLADDMDLQALIERFTTEDDNEGANKYPAHVLKQIQSELNDECPICSEEPMVEQSVTGCWHSACKKCLMDYIQHQRDKDVTPRCFNCREPINSRDIFEVIRHDNIEMEDDQGSMGIQTIKPEVKPEESTEQRISLRRVGCNGSAKVQALLTHLKTARNEDPNIKSVVFSQFTSFLDLIEPALTRDRIQFLRFDGTMAQKQRAAVLNDFTNRKKSTVLLLSLRAGGVGLNLTSAKTVYMMDPWWSFAVEAQAIDRVHRMGQEHEVKVFRFIVNGSIEEKMLRIQERKKFIASSLGMMNNEEKKLQRIEDIKELLS